MFVTPVVDIPTGIPVPHPDIPEYINEFFTNIGPKLAENFDNTWTDDLPYIEHCMLEEFVFSEREVTNAIKEIDINKSASVDNMATRVLKDAFEYLIPQLTHMFNCSLTMSSFPDDWKRATVVPLQKSGDKSNVSNLRPVSLLPLPGKVLEKLFHNKISNYLDENKLINDGQNGFRKGRSTIGTVAELTDDILLGVNNKDYTIAAFVDLRKAFDTVSHEILGKKLHKFGFHDNIIAWLKNYLCNRSQRCKVNGSISNYSNITCGVPQGSILGPMLFLLYINDINTMLNRCKTKLYADDTVVYATHNSEQICYDWLCNDLEMLIEWFNNNKLTINLDKTKLMLFATKNMQKRANFPQVEISGTKLQYVRHFNYLGVKLDSRLTFEMHANECLRLVSHKIFLLTKIRKYIDKKQALTIYKSKIMPYFDYGDIFLLGVQVKTKDMLQKLQNRALRLVLNRDSRHNVWELHHEALTPMLDKRRECHLLNCMYKRKHQPQYIQNPRRQLRVYEGPVFIEYQSQNATFERSVMFRGSKAWNHLPVDTRNMQNYDLFKKNTKQSMLNHII